MALPKFHFDTEFHTAGDVVSQAARGRVKKTLTQDELDQLRAEAHGEGLKSGETRALEAVAQSVKETAAVIRHTLSQTQRDIEKVREEAAQIAFVVARKLVPIALDALPAADVERALRDAIHQAIGEPRVVLRANPRVIEALNGQLAEIALEEGYEGRLVGVAYWRSLGRCGHQAQRAGSRSRFRRARHGFCGARQIRDGSEPASEARQGHHCRTRPQSRRSHRYLRQ